MGQEQTRLVIVLVHKDDHMLGNALCHALCFHSQIIPHSNSITNNIIDKEYNESYYQNNQSYSKTVQSYYQNNQSYWKTTQSYQSYNPTLTEVPKELLLGWQCPIFGRGGWNKYGNNGKRSVSPLLLASPSPPPNYGPN